MGKRTVVDASGAYCPGPLMELIATLKLVEIGDEVEVLSTDKGSAMDIPAWVEKVKHAMVDIEKKEKAWHIVVKKMK